MNYFFQIGEQSQYNAFDFYFSDCDHDGIPITYKEMKRHHDMTNYLNIYSWEKQMD